MENLVKRSQAQGLIAKNPSESNLSDVTEVSEYEEYNKVDSMNNNGINASWELTGSVLGLNSFESKI